MFDTTDPAEDPAAPPRCAPEMQRARGAARVALDGCGGGVGRARLGRLAQSGCAKAFLPRVTGPTEVVFLNTAGGLTGGDRVRFALDLGAGARAIATTQAAERAYAALPGAAPARMDVALTVGAGGRLDWLPQETILYDAAALDRRTEVDLAGDAQVLLCETLVLGRAAMGERVTRLALRDLRRVRRAGRPVLADGVALDAGALAADDAGAGLAGARAVALLALVAPGAEAAVGPLRGVLAGTDPGVRAAVSGWDGRCAVRIAGPDGWPVKRALAALLRHLREGALPRVWQV